MYDKKTRLSVLSMTDTVFPGGMNIHHLKTLAIDQVHGYFIPVSRKINKLLVSLLI
jgi:hypothetical protein